MDNLVWKGLLPSMIDKLQQQTINYATQTGTVKIKKFSIKLHMLLQIIFETQN